ncbi:MAG: hypothetical protein INR69_15705 [Mucilaginibacter polytrichastri]|nr:hypothetical protein [Mucilaginibacter polytrichastri]
MKIIRRIFYVLATMLVIACIAFFVLVNVLRRVFSYDDRLSISNQTEQGVYYIYSKRVGLDRISERVDLFFAAKERWGDTSYTNYLPPKRNTRIVINPSWDGWVESTPGKHVNFYFFPLDTMKKYTWEQIQAGARCTHSVSYTIEELEKRNWIINYPPDK